MQNKDSEDGPILDPNSEKKVFTFPKSTSKTDSSRQIICQPLKILNENQNFRLVCVYEDLEFDAENYQMLRNYDRSSPSRISGDMSRILHFPGYQALFHTGCISSLSSYHNQPEPRFRTS